MKLYGIQRLRGPEDGWGDYHAFSNEVEKLVEITDCNSWSVGPYSSQPTKVVRYSTSYKEDVYPAYRIVELPYVV